LLLLTFLRWSSAVLQLLTMQSHSIKRWLVLTLSSTARDLSPDAFHALPRLAHQGLADRRISSAATFEPPG
jgi:hypothetical protein